MRNFFSLDHRIYRILLIIVYRNVIVYSLKKIHRYRESEVNAIEASREKLLSLCRSIATEIRYS